MFKVKKGDRKIETGYIKKGLKEDRTRDRRGGTHGRVISLCILIRTSQASRHLV